ncbi:Pleckstrin homology domain-containing proteinzC-PhzF [Phytophthora infestans]|uniref:Pleckstrin homology domain-containing proteinzC-PhzF n=1 Tax=Phytophthora infestans TaxID=4787 RepID=A0A833W5C3_PHYIN|nr:Pleckstrin homology domain-containing proteinzC-PhzF [Phytophthora infestans]
MDFPEQPTTPAGPTVRATTDRLVHVTSAGFTTLEPICVQLDKYDVRGVAVTAGAPADNALNVDFQSRFFAPRGGVNEDPVTGCGHCAFGPYWAPLLEKTKIKAQQFTPIRGGYITLDLVAAGPGRVLLKGEGVIVLRGQLSLSP